MLARSTSGTSPFIKQRPATVDGNGTFRAVFNLDGVSQGTTFSVLVRQNGSELTSTTGRVACDDGCGSETPDVREEEPAVAALADAEVGVVQVANGSVARVRVRLGDADAALLSVRSPEASYALDATVDDGDDDGTVVLLFDTATAARAGPPLEVATGADSVVVRDERGAFAATDYRIALHPVGNESATAATGLLVVTRNASAGTPLLTTGPGGGGDLPLGSAGALFVGTLLAVVGLASLLGLVDVRDLLGP